MDGITVPLMVDDVKSHPEFAFSRCSYFTIECDVPAPGWELTMEDARIPFLMIGLSGIIYCPFGKSAIFRSPGEIESLFETIEQDGRLSVGTADLWLPNAVMKGILPDRKPRGVSFRVGQELFRRALAFRLDRIPQDQFEDMVLDMSQELTYSEEEDRAFLEWRQKQVDLAKEQYRKTEEHALKWRETNGPDRNGEEQ
jgi:hypothetical protein